MLNIQKQTMLNGKKTNVLRFGSDVLAHSTCQYKLVPDIMYYYNRNPKIAVGPNVKALLARIGNVAAKLNK